MYAIVGERIVARLRKQVFDAIMRQDVAFFDRNKTGELINRLSSDSAVIQSSLSVNISMGLRFSATVIGGIIILFVISWKLTLVMLSILPIVVGAARFYGRVIKALSKSVQDALAAATEVSEGWFFFVLFCWRVDFFFLLKNVSQIFEPLDRSQRSHLRWIDTLQELRVHILLE